MTTTCPTSYYQDIAACSDEIILQLTGSTGFAKGDDYLIRLTYPNGSIKIIAVESSSYDGLIILPNNELWDISTGVITIEIFTADYSTQISPTFCETEYNNIVLTVQQITTDDTTTYIPIC